ncbi:MAG: hypothetical protein DCC67_02415 [Planctomycetota bacterium]|nr:MAG: hypothetical protein DCC67_02415 [Planctomycetota bacterium]
MKRYVNLMTESAQFGVAAREQLQRWALVAALLIAAAAPVVFFRVREHTRVRQQHEALEATYEPVRRLNERNRQLRREAIGLVRDERLSLELSRQRPIVSLLARVGAAASETRGEVFVERISVDQRVPGAAHPASAQDRMTVEAAATLTYDISEFAKALEAPPITAVKVTSEVITAEGGVDRKSYTLECQL